MGKQVEALKDHADLGAFAADLPLRELVDLAVALAVADELAVHREPAGVDLLEMVDASQERAFSGA